jgi:hypothetical protein
LDRYVIDSHRHSAARKRSPRGAVIDVDSQREILASRSGPTDSAFDVAWAREVIGEVLTAMQQQCREADKPQLWEVFDARYLKPAMDNTPAESHESLAGRLKLDSPHAAANLLVTAKRLFTRLFKTVVARYAADEAEIREEVADLWRIFAAAGR